MRITALFLAFAFWATPIARAAKARTVHLVGDSSSCPSPSLAASELKKLLGHTTVDTDPSGTTEIWALSDEGETYRLTANGIARAFSDPARRCEERARAIAVFIALLIEPPMFDGPDDALVAKKVTPPRSRFRLASDIELLAQLDATPEDRGGIAGGSMVRASIGLPFVRVTLGVGGLSPVDLQIGDVRGRFTRIPLDLGLRGVLRRGRVELDGDLGFAATVTQGQGVSLPRNSQGVRLDPGIRLAISLRIWFENRVAPFVGFQTVIAPEPIDLALNPVGKVGSAPQFWLGAILGLTVRLH